MKLYNELYDWWSLLSPVEDYEEESKIYLDIFRKYKDRPTTCLELGSGGGNNAFYMKEQLQMTLTDISPKMLEVSKSINPGCRHLLGDMRSLDLEQTFDSVFIHDAISYIANVRDLSKVFETVNRHLEPGGVALIMPDDFKETFQAQTETGGVDKDGRALRYLEWTYDPDPNDNRISAEYAYIMRDRKGNVMYDNEHVEYGLFPMSTWNSLVSESGFTVQFEKVDFSDQPGKSYFAIVAIKI